MAESQRTTRMLQARRVNGSRTRSDRISAPAEMASAQQ
jgi:hypothetical protein